MHRGREIAQKALCIPDLETRCKLVVSFTLQLLYTDAHLIGDGRPQKLRWPKETLQSCRHFSELQSMSSAKLCEVSTSEAAVYVHILRFRSYTFFALRRIQCILQILRLYRFVTWNGAITRNDEVHSGCSSY
jgi:hypothetical protein